MATTNSSSAPSRGFPLWAKIILSLFVLLVLVALALPYFLDIDRYRDTIAEAIGKQTGRKVTLGQLRARIFPGVGLTVAGLHIGNPKGFPDGDVVSADEIDVNVAIGPLMNRVVHVNSVNLVHPKVALLTDASGKDNYTFTADASAITHRVERPADVVGRPGAESIAWRGDWHGGDFQLEQTTPQHDQ